MFPLVAGVPLLDCAFFILTEDKDWFLKQTLELAGRLVWEDSNIEQGILVLEAIDCCCGVFFCCRCGWDWSTGDFGRIVGLVPTAAADGLLTIVALEDGEGNGAIGLR